MSDHDTKCSACDGTGMMPIEPPVGQSNYSGCIECIGTGLAPVQDHLKEVYDECKRLETEVDAWHELNQMSFEVARCRVECAPDEDNDECKAARRWLRDARQRLSDITGGRWPMPAVGGVTGRMSGGSEVH